jgi:hypothetical protein
MVVGDGWIKYMITRYRVDILSKRSAEEIDVE